MTINEMNLTQVNEAIALAEVNFHAVKPEARAELTERLRQLYARRFELEGAAKRARARQRFSRFTQPRPCRMCGKLTTWSEANGNCGLDLCKACFDQATLDNEHYDGYHADQPHAGCRLCQEVK